MNFAYRIGPMAWLAHISFCLPILVVPYTASQAQSTTSEGPRSTLSLTVGAGRLVRLAHPASTVFVAEPQIADVQTPGADRVFIFGKKPGRTTVFALDASGNQIGSWAVAVEPEQTTLGNQRPVAASRTPPVLDTTTNGAVLSGTTANAGLAARLGDVAGTTAGPGRPVSNELRVAHSTQVNLRVRVAEVSRTVSRQIGFNWSTIASVGSFAFGLQTGRLAGTGASLVGSGLNGVFGTATTSHLTASTVLDAMATEQLVTMLAEPNLTAISGSTATFLAGGEFPVPVPQALGVTSIQYVQYGVSVAFTPTVEGSGLISMKVRPEVSALSTSGSYSLNGVNVPALTTRRAETEVELASGQSFAIAGLIRNDSDNNVQKVPLLGDIPVLGQLFRSNQFQRDQTELVIVVTPYIVKPVDPLHPPDDPTQHIKQASDVERLLYGRMGDGQDLSAVPRLHGVGFMFE